MENVTLYCLSIILSIYLLFVCLSIYLYPICLSLYPICVSHSVYLYLSVHPPRFPPHPTTFLMKCNCNWLKIANSNLNIILQEGQRPIYFLKKNSNIKYENFVLYYSIRNSFASVKFKEIIYSSAILVILEMNISFTARYK